MRYLGLAFVAAARAVAAPAGGSAQQRTAQIAPNVTRQMSTYPASFPEHSPRNANYSIDVELDPSTRTMTGREVVTWRNITSKPASELQFHTYWNAWRNTRSTFMREWLRVSGGTPDAAEVLSRPPSEWSSLDVTAFGLLSGGATAMTDLMPAARYIAPTTAMSKTGRCWR